MTRRRTVAAPVEEVWAVAGDPYHRPRWWPAVARVEDVTESAWTDVVRSSRGRFVRADFTKVDLEPPREMSWRLEVEASPFERFMAESHHGLRLEPADQGRTQVELWTRQRLRGVSRLGALIARRAATRQLADALEALEQLVAAPAGEGGRSG